MKKSLVIVESPAKVKTIHKFLGKNYVVKSSVGHIRDLPKSGGATSSAEKKKAPKRTAGDAAKLKENKLFSRMGIDPLQGWKAQYEIVPGKEKILKGLQDAAKDADIIYLATDLDREGEAIAWHLKEAIGGDESRYQRVTFTEITKKAILAAFEKPGVLNLDRVNAQQARRFLDRVVGYMLSPLLWAKIARGLSAGRVQSVAVRIISEREGEIHAFKPEEFWEVAVATQTKKKEPLVLSVHKFQDQAFSPKTKDDVVRAEALLRAAPYTIEKIERKPTQSKPSAPFITSTLQQAASVRFGFGVKKTMTLAQKLYEAGLITYMRTDSTNLSVDAVTACRAFIETRYGKKYLPEEPLRYSSKKTAQEAHEAIRPTEVETLPQQVVADKDEARLYQLIWEQFVACQMTPAQFDGSTITVRCGDFELRARGKILLFDGFLKVLGRNKKEDDIELPAIAEKEPLALQDVLPTQKFTKPPPRFTEASLVREMEKQGIGRPSTYAAVISTIQERGYVRAEKRRFFSLKMGDIVTARLVENFAELMDYQFTANLEEDLDRIAAGEANWQTVLDNFYASFTKKLESAQSDMRGNPPTLTDIDCPTCHTRKMMLRTARTGVFLSCTGYELPVAERCKGTLNLVPGEEAELLAGEEESEEGNVAEIQAMKRCPLCDKAMDSYLIDDARKIHICGDNPECAGYLLEKGKFRIKGYEGPSIVCDKCGSQMHLKTGRFGKYFGCSTAPDCKNTRKLMRNGEAAPPKSDPIHMRELKCEQSAGYFILRDSAAGIFLASSEFPRSRETRRPQVEDLLRHKTELDPKYKFLLTAATKDPEGNPAVIRFSRKSKAHFITSEVNGKQTDWVLVYRESSKKWEVGQV